MIKKLLLVAALVFPSFALAAPAPPPMREAVAVCDPAYPTTRCIVVNADGSINTSGGGGGGGAVTVADGADVTQGAVADTASTAGGVGTLSAKLRLMTTQLGTLNTTLGTPFQAGGSIGNTAFGITGAIPAGTNVIGHVITDTGSTTVVTTLPALVAGSAIIGKVGIDQTTPGTTNLVALAANQSVNTAQVNGVTTLTGTGAVGTGAQRVAVGTDTATIAGSAPGTAGSASTNVLTIQGIASMTKLLVTPDANAAVNIAQMNGVTTTMGNGVAGTGVQRVAIASDNTAIAGVCAGTTGSAVPSCALYLGTSQSALNKGVTGCDTHAFYDASDNGKKTVVAGVSAKKIYICGYILATGGTATNLSLTSGTGTDCVTTSTAITPAYQLATNDRTGANSPFWNGLITLANADNLCVNASAGNAHQVEVWYTIQ